MSIFLDQIPPGSPVVVVLVEMPDCPACLEYHPIFARVAEAYAKRGLPIIRVDAANPDSGASKFMDVHNVDSTPTVLAATLRRGPVAKLVGVSNEFETRRLFDVAWAHNRR